VLIRAASDDDAAAVAALWTEGYTNRGPGGRSTPYEEWEFAEARRHGSLSVAVDGSGAVVGVVAFNAPGSPGRVLRGEAEAELSRLVVATAARGTGTGRMLAELCGRQARAAGAGSIALWSRPYQVEAHRLYESLGYRRAPERDSRDGDGERLVFVLDFDA